ncbi:hypothetical protein V2I78_05680 [Pseudomonas viridiflava]|uniref:hypothetical protein n=1 Tax=Pseudomonas viridiflava TaxID=33069 RepID=UPI002EC8DBC6|nr:hypothetical protein [Pseudomonas viridiflava]
MNVLIAHPQPSSFDGALTPIAVRTLREMGHEVQVGDLYPMKRKSVLAPDDFVSRTDPARFQPLEEIGTF